VRQKEDVRKILVTCRRSSACIQGDGQAMLDHLALLKGLAGPAERRETVEALLQQTNLWEVRKRRLGTFSGGMKQRFGIAQALIGSPG